MDDKSFIRLEVGLGMSLVGIIGLVARLRASAPRLRGRAPDN